MTPILVLLRKDFTLFLKDRVSILLTFIVPFGLIYLFGQIYHVNSADSGPSGIPIGVVNQSQDPSAAGLVKALQEQKAFKVITTYSMPDKSTRPLEEADLTALMRSDAFRFALVIPKDVIRADEFGVHLKTYSNPRNAIEAQTVRGLLQQVLYSEAPQLIGKSMQESARAWVGSARLDAFDAAVSSAIADTFGGDEGEIRRNMKDGKLTLPSLGKGHRLGGGPVSIEDTQVVGQDVKSPMATILVGGWAIQFLLFALTSSSAALFYERDQGLFQRILSAPVTRGQILASKFLYGIFLGLLQLSALFLAGHVLYGIEIGRQAPLLLLVCFIAAAACSSFGMLIAALSPTPEAARGMSTFVILFMCAVGGAWFPVSFMPGFMQQLSHLTLVYWAMEGFSQVLWARASLLEVLPTIGWLAFIAGLTISVALWRFRRGRIFE